MTTVTVLSSKSYTVGAHAYGPVAVPLNVASVVLALDRTTWVNAAAKADMRLEMSFDGGTVWQVIGGFTAQGGAVLNMDGSAATVSSFSISLPQPSNANRKLRGTLTVSGASFTTSGTVTLT